MKAYKIQAEADTGTGDHELGWVEFYLGYVIIWYASSAKLPFAPTELGRQWNIKTQVNCQPNLGSRPPLSPYT